MANNRNIILFLSAIVLLNIIAILLINNKLANDKLSELSASSGSSQQNANAQQGTKGSIQDPSIAQGSQASDAATNDIPARAVIRVQPLVKTYVMKATCKNCDDLYDITKYLSALNETINMDISYVTPQEIGITPARLPALLFNESIEQYPPIIAGWENNGIIAPSTKSTYPGKWYVLPVLHAPFYDTAADTVRGRVSVTYLMMGSCKQCFDVPGLRSELEKINIKPYHEEIVDVSSERGKTLIRKYNITAVPTILLDNQATFHIEIFPGWYVAGTVEDDGTLVLRKLDRMHITYYDLKHEQLMTP